MVKVEGSDITITRGDTLIGQIIIKDSRGIIYDPGENDLVRFALKKSYKDESPLIVKDIPVDTMILRLESSDTKALAQPQKYFYDIQITIDDGTEEGFVYTFISGTLKTVEEVE